MGKHRGNDCKGGKDCNDNNHICKVSKENDLDRIRQLVRDAHYVCRKCGRAAHEEANLCKPTDL